MRATKTAKKLNTKISIDTRKNCSLGIRKNAAESLRFWDRNGTANSDKPPSMANVPLLYFVSFLEVSVDRVAVFPCLYALACANRIRHYRH